MQSEHSQDFPLSREMMGTCKWELLRQKVAQLLIYIPTPLPLIISKTVKLTVKYIRHKM